MKAKFASMILVFLFTLCPVAAMASDTIIVVVRHAEKASDDPKDPGLNEQGKIRANKLADMLRHADLQAVFTTQYRRTQQTGLPAASHAGLALQVRAATRENSETYAADLLKEIRKKYRGKTVLIVGHSNTVPEIVKQMAGIDIGPIGESSFDRFYVISLGKKARVVSSSY
jgi:broad specificity phosphatase PhoE